MHSELVQGKLFVRAAYVGENEISPDAVKFEVKILRAEDLARADGPFGLSDPYVIVKWDGRELGRTPYKPKTLNPEWDDQIFGFSVPSLDDIPKHELHMDIWDHNQFTRGVFLGCVILNEDVLTELLSYEDEITRTFDVTKNELRPDLPQDNVRGFLVIKVKRVVEEIDSSGPEIHVSWNRERWARISLSALSLSLSLSFSHRHCRLQRFRSWKPDNRSRHSFGPQFDRGENNRGFNRPILHVVLGQRRKGLDCCLKRQGAELDLPSSELDRP